MKYKVGDKTVLGEIINVDEMRLHGLPYCVRLSRATDTYIWLTEPEIDAIIVKPKRNIDHLIELWQAHREEDARRGYLAIIYNTSIYAEDGDEIYELMKPYVEPSKYPKLTPEEEMAVMWLQGVGYTEIKKDPIDVKASYMGFRFWVANAPLTGCLCESNWITTEPINLAELLAAQEEV